MDGEPCGIIPRISFYVCVCGFFFLLLKVMHPLLDKQQQQTTYIGVWRRKQKLALDHHRETMIPMVNYIIFSSVHCFPPWCMEICFSERDYSSSPSEASVIHRTCFGQWIWWKGCATSPWLYSVCYEKDKVAKKGCHLRINRRTKKSHEGELQLILSWHEMSKSLTFIVMPLNFRIIYYGSIIS